MVRGRADIPLIRPSFSSELPVNVSPRSKVAPVRPRPETLVLDSSKRPMDKIKYEVDKIKYGVMNGRSQKVCWVIPIFSVYPCIHKDFS
jgi:hypothetical protein